MIENIRLSLKGIWSHKMRSFLTMLGIIIGIAAIIAIVSTIKGTNEQIKRNLVNVKLSQDGYEVDSDQLPYGTPVMNEEALNQIKSIENVENASFYRSRSYADSIYYQSILLDGASVKGIDENYFSTMGYIIKRGRSFIESDYNEFRKNVILDQFAASSLFK